MVIFSLGSRSMLRSGSAKRHARGAKGIQTQRSSNIQRVFATVTALAAPFKTCFPTAVHDYIPAASPSTSPPSSPSTSQSSEPDTQKDDFHVLTTDELLEEIQQFFESFQTLQKLVAESKGMKKQERRKHALEQWAKDNVYHPLEEVVGYYQVIFDAGFGHLLGEDVNVSDMDVEPVVRTHAAAGASAGIVAADAPMRRNPCVTGLGLNFDEPEKLYNSPTNSGIKRKRAEVAGEEEQHQEEEDDDSCKRHKLSEYSSLEMLLEYLNQCSRETLICEAQIWAFKRAQMKAELDEHLEKRDAIQADNDSREAALMAESERLRIEIHRLGVIFEDNNILGLVLHLNPNEDGDSYTSEDGSVYLGMPDAEAEEEKKEEEEEISSSPAVDAGMEGKENDNMNSNESNKENGAAPSLKQRILVPIGNAQRWVLKECHRRFQMRERRGETRW